MSSVAYAPIPGAPGYASNDLAAKAAYQKALTTVNTQRSGLLRQYGYTGQIDPTTGTVTQVAVDPYNQYGQLQSMLRNQAMEDQGAVDDANARGLVGGLANQEQDQLRYAHGAQSAQLGQNLVGGLGDLANQQDAAYNEYQNTLWQDQLAAAEQAIANGQFTTPDFSSIAYPTYGDTSYDNSTTANASPTAKPTAKPANNTARSKALVANVTARRVKANKTGATVQGKRGIISIH